MENLAAQLWTVRSLCADARGLASTLTALRSIGYNAVELAGLAAIPPADVRRILDDTGVAACAAHADAELILRDPGAVAATLHTLGCASVVYPYPRNQDLSSVEGVARLCSLLGSAGALFAAEGIKLSYHNHNLELQKLGGKTVLQTILERTDPKLLQVELDTYWLQAGGVDPARWIESCAQREELLHIKDYGVDREGRPKFKEIGAGNLDWDGILSAAWKVGCRWLIVEQDDHWTTGDPLESLRASWDYLARSQES